MGTMDDTKWLLDHNLQDEFMRLHDLPTSELPTAIVDALGVYNRSEAVIAYLRNITGENEIATMEQTWIEYVADHLSDPSTVSEISERWEHISPQSVTADYADNIYQDVAVLLAAHEQQALKLDKLNDRIISLEYALEGQKSQVTIEANYAQKLWKDLTAAQGKTTRLETIIREMVQELNSQGNVHHHALVVKALRALDFDDDMIRQYLAGELIL